MTTDEERFAAIYPNLLRFAAVVAPSEDDPADLLTTHSPVSWQRAALAVSTIG